MPGEMEATRLTRAPALGRLSKITSPQCVSSFLRLVHLLAQDADADADALLVCRFRWRDGASQEEIVVMYHRSYGSNFELSGGGGVYPNTTLISESSGTALASYFRSDNTVSDSGAPVNLTSVLFMCARFVAFDNAFKGSDPLL